MLRVSGAFVTRFYEEWKSAGDTMLHCYDRETWGERHARVERFLEAMKYDLVKVLVPVENAETAKQFADRLQKMLDKVSYI